MARARAEYGLRWWAAAPRRWRDRVRLHPAWTHPTTTNGTEVAGGSGKAPDTGLGGWR